MCIRDRDTTEDAGRRARKTTPYRAASRWSRRRPLPLRLELEAPEFRDRRLAEHSMTLGADALESRRLVQVPRRRQLALRPEIDALVAGVARKLHDFIH